MNYLIFTINGSEEKMRAEYKDGTLIIHNFPEGINFDTPEWWNVPLGGCFKLEDKEAGEFLAGSITEGGKLFEEFIRKQERDKNGSD